MTYVVLVMVMVMVMMMMMMWISRRCDQVSKERSGEIEDRTMYLPTPLARGSRSRIYFDMQDWGTHKGHDARSCAADPVSL